MPTPFLGSETFTVIPTVNSDPLTVSASGSIPSISGGLGAPVTAPTYGTGSLYVDITNYQLYLYEGSAWSLIGDNSFAYSISAATTAGTGVNTSYIYFVSGNTTVTLPTAVGNTSIYTVKKVDSNTTTTTIATTSSQTIDGSSTAIIQVRYTSLTLISDGANWNLI